MWAIDIGFNTKITSVPVWRGLQHQREVGLSDEGPVGKLAQSPQPSKQQDFSDNVIMKTNMFSLEMQQIDNEQKCTHFNLMTTYKVFILRKQFITTFHNITFYFYYFV